MKNWIRTGDGRWINLDNIEFLSIKKDVSEDFIVTAYGCNVSDAMFARHIVAFFKTREEAQIYLDTFMQEHT